MVSAANIQIAHSSQDMPSESDIDDWIRKALTYTGKEGSELAVRIVDKSESASLNKLYRQQNGPTDVLSFPARLPNGLDIELLGDVVVCADVVNQVAAETNVDPDAHWARIIIHGILHLCGFDHKDLRQAEIMELAEFQILKLLNLEHPELTFEQTQ